MDSELGPTKNEVSGEDYAIWDQLASYPDYEQNKPFRTPAAHAA